MQTPEEEMPTRQEIIEDSTKLLSVLAQIVDDYMCTALDVDTSNHNTCDDCRMCTTIYQAHHTISTFVFSRILSPYRCEYNCRGSCGRTISRRMVAQHGMRPFSIRNGGRGYRCYVHACVCWLDPANTRSFYCDDCGERMCASCQYRCACVR